MILSWSPIEGAFAVTGSKSTAVDTLWRLVPESERTPARRRLVLALVGHIREYHDRTGRLCPDPDVGGAQA